MCRATSGDNLRTGWSGVSGEVTGLCGARALQWFGNLKEMEGETEKDWVAAVSCCYLAGPHVLPGCQWTNEKRPWITLGRAPHGPLRFPALGEQGSQVNTSQNCTQQQTPCNLLVCLGTSAESLSNDTDAGSTL